MFVVELKEKVSETKAIEGEEETGEVEIGHKDGDKGWPGRGTSRGDTRWFLKLGGKDEEGETNKSG